MFEYTNYNCDTYLISITSVTKKIIQGEESTQKIKNARIEQANAMFVSLIVNGLPKSEVNEMFSFRAFNILSSFK